MMKARVFIILLSILALAASAAFSCSKSDDSEMKEGYYTAEAADFDDFGWKEYLTIYVSSNKILTVDYNAKNASGFIKSWDMDYMRTMDSVNGTYPNKYSRGYANMLISRQTPDKVDLISGATHSYTTFKMLAAAAIGKAKAGDKSVAFVDLSSLQNSGD